MLKKSTIDNQIFFGNILLKYQSSSTQILTDRRKKKLVMLKSLVSHRCSCLQIIF